MKTEEKIKTFEKLKEMSKVDKEKAPAYNIGFLDAIQEFHKFINSLDNE